MQRDITVSLVVGDSLGRWEGGIEGRKSKEYFQRTIFPTNFQ